MIDILFCKCRGRTGRQQTQPDLSPVARDSNKGRGSSVWGDCWSFLQPREIRQPLHVNIAVNGEVRSLTTGFCCWV